MLIRTIVCSVLCVALFGRHAARAQDTTHLAHDSARLPHDTARLPPSGKWDLQTCLDYAIKNNIQINSLRLTEKTSEQAYLLSKAATLPNLYASLGQTGTHSKNANPVVGGFQTQATVAGSYSLSSSVTLYKGGYLKDVIRENNLEIQSANLNILQSENDITLQITQAYLNILLAKENVVYVKDLVSSTIAQVDQGKKQ